VTEGESHSIKQSHLMQDGTWLNWQWSVQEQECRRSQLASHVVSFWFFRTSHKRFEQLYWTQWSHDVKTL